LAAIAQAHFGKNFSRVNLPGNWSSSGNSLEKAAFLAKDAIFVIDDCAPQSTPNGANELNRKVEQILRGQGNSAGRGRMYANGELRQEYFSRAMIISTGEDVPKGQSILARCFILGISPGDVDLGVLTEMQKTAANGGFAACMAGYIEFVASKSASLKEQLTAKFEKYRAEAREHNFLHDRTPDQFASLMLGLDMFVDFALSSGAISQVEYNNFLNDGKLILLEVAKLQATYQSDSNPIEKYFDTIRTALQTKQAYLLGMDGERPKKHAELCGDYQSFPVNGKHIGFIDTGKSCVYLIPLSAYRLIELELVRQWPPNGNHVEWTQSKINVNQSLIDFCDGKLWLPKYVYLDLNANLIGEERVLVNAKTSKTRKGNGTVLIKQGINS